MNGTPILRNSVENPLEAQLSISKQCELLGLPRSSFYYKPVPETALNLELMRLIDEKYMERPHFGTRNMTLHLREQNFLVNRKRVQGLYRKMGIEAQHPKPRFKTSENHLKYPYLLKNLKISAVNQVWGSDITYIPTCDGYLYLVAVLDLYSRYVVSWRLSNSLETEFCLEALDEALKFGKPEIFNTDKGVQFTANQFTGCLQKNGIQISMNGKGRCWDNIFVERLWRTIKYEEVYLKGYESGEEAFHNLDSYMAYYNEERRHGSLEHRTPAEVFRGCK